MGSRKQRIFAAALLMLALISAATGAVYAYLSATTGAVNNSFTAAPDHTISIQENFTTAPSSPNLVKEKVCVDVGDPGYAVYVRVAIVATWQKKTADGKTEIHWQKPEGGTLEAKGVDYVLDWNDEKWFLGSDGFYYLKSMVTYGETPVLINRCYQCHEAPEADYTLHIEIIAQTIQALGSTDTNGTPAVTAAWGVYVDSEQKLTDTEPTT